MLVATLKDPVKRLRLRRVALFAVGFALCATILAITVIEKLTEGGWITLLITSVLILLCVSIKAHYLEVAQALHRLQISLDRVEPRGRIHAPLAPGERTAVVLVGGYGGLGIHTVQTILQTFPGVFKNLVFVSVGVVDSGGFKGEDAIEQLKHSTEAMLEKYVRLGAKLGVASIYRMAIGTDVVLEGERLCRDVAHEFPQATFFTGKIIFENERWFQRLLHNETGLALQKRLQLAGLTMVVLPAKVA
jgi:hypothetical protein